MKILRLFFLIFVWTGLAAGQDADWSSLSKHLGKQVIVAGTDGQYHAGKLLRVEEQRVIIQENGTPTGIARNSVQKITRHHSRNKAGWIAGMSAAGLGMGFVLGFRAFDDAINAERKIGVAAAAGAGGGAALGYLISRGHREEVIYVAPVP